jgi:hypothetical protein
MRAEHVAVSIALILSCTQPLSAQSIPVLGRGTRVRVVIPADSARPERALSAGNLVHLSGDTVAIAGGLHQPETFILGPGRRLEVRTGPGRGHAGKGALWGLLVGGFGGAIIAAAAYQPCPANSLCVADMGSGGSAAGGFLLGGLAGAGLGAIIGSGIRHEEWTPVPTSGVRVGLLVLPRGAGLSVQSPF